MARCLLNLTDNFTSSSRASMVDDRGIEVRFSVEKGTSSPRLTDVASKYRGYNGRSFKLIIDLVVTPRSRLHGPIPPLYTHMRYIIWPNQLNIGKTSFLVSIWPVWDDAKFQLNPPNILQDDTWEERMYT
jgi:hypothetical protein